MSQIIRVIDRHQIPISRNVLLAIYLGNYVGSTWWAPLHKHTHRFLHLQHVAERSEGRLYYDIGINDTYHVLYWVVLLTFLRAVLMQHLFDPVAKRVLHVRSRKARLRFAEQSWMLVYYTASFALGLYLYYHSPYWNNIDNIFVGWPHYKMTPLFKKYYLISIAFWLQQVLVLHIEKRRKDHVQMFCHHLVTCCLVIGSYYYYYSRIGNLILIIMDSNDILLSAAKILRYCSFQRACDAMFVCFVVAWVSLRHGVYNYLFYISWYRSMDLMSDSRCVPGLVQKRCWNMSIVNGFLSLLGGLQVLLLIWLYMIFKVVIKVVRGQNAEDVRSDEDDTDTEKPQCIQPSESSESETQEKNSESETPESLPESSTFPENTDS